MCNRLHIKFYFKFGIFKKMFINLLRQMIFNYLNEKQMKKTAIQIILIVLGAILLCFADNL